MTTTKINGFLPEYDRVVDQVIVRYAAIREMFVQGNVVGAQQAMEELAAYHARQSLALRNTLIRKGFELTTEGDDEG